MPVGDQPDTGQAGDGEQRVEGVDEGDRGGGEGEREAAEQAEREDDPVAQGTGEAAGDGERGDHQTPRGVDDRLDTHEGGDERRRVTVLDLGGLGGGEEVDHGTERGDDGHRRADRQQPAEAVADRWVPPEREESGGDAGEAQQRDEVGGVPRGVDEHRVQLLGLVALVAPRGVQRAAGEERGAAGDQEQVAGAVSAWCGGGGVREWFRVVMSPRSTEAAPSTSGRTRDQFEGQPWYVDAPSRANIST